MFLSGRANVRALTSRVRARFVFTFFTFWAHLALALSPLGRIAPLDLQQVGALKPGGDTFYDPGSPL